MVLAVCCSSCFQVIEEVTVNDNGSGTVTLTANMSQSRTKLASVMLLDSVNGYKVPSQAEVRKELADVAARLGKMQGISNVTHQVDFDKYIAHIRFSFKQVDNLNQVMETIFKEVKVNAGNRNSYSYDVRQRIFTRTYSHLPQATAEYNKLKPADREVLQGATFTAIYRFGSEVTRYTNPTAKVAASRKAVMLQTAIMDLVNGKQSLSNQINLSR